MKSRYYKYLDTRFPKQRFKYKAIYYNYIIDRMNIEHGEGIRYWRELTHKLIEQAQSTAWLAEGEARRRELEL